MNWVCTQLRRVKEHVPIVQLAVTLRLSSTTESRMAEVGRDLWRYLAQAPCSKQSYLQQIYQDINWPGFEYV